MENGTFKTLNKININDKTEKKNKLSYLSWTWAWSKVKESYPDASYQIWKDEKGNPYTFDETLGYMCYTSVCIEGETLEMWLPVMNGANKAMKKDPYTYQVKKWNSSEMEDKYVLSASMFDINKTIMRCLVKNLAMFGLGLYIYSGEDLPEQEPEPVKKTLTNESIERMCKTQKDEFLKESLTKYNLTEFQVKAINTKLGIDS